MRLHRLSAFALLTLLVLGCGKKPAPDAPPEPTPAPGAPPAVAKGIEGAYLIVGGEIWGKKATDEEITKDSELERTVKITKDRIQFKFLKREVVSYKLDPSKSPAEIDLTSDEGKKSTTYGIYKVEGDILTVFVMGAEEPRLRPREFKTLDPFKDAKADKKPEPEVGGYMLLTLKRVGDDTTFVTDPPKPPKPPEVDLDGPVVAELTKKGFQAEKSPGRFGGVWVTVPSTLPPDAAKGLSGEPRIRTITFKTTRFEDNFHPVTDDAVRALTGLDGLEALTFQSCDKLTSAAFRDVTRFPALTHIDVNGALIDDDAIAEVAKIKALEWIRLSSPKMTDKSLAALSGVRSLKVVMLGDMSVTPAGVKKLNALPELELLWLQGTPGADAALAELAMPKVRDLNFAQSKITDAGLSKLPPLPALESIFLTSPEVTDAGLKHLLKQPKLEKIELFGTKATKAGVDELRKLNPKLRIYGVD